MKLRVVSIENDDYGCAPIFFWNIKVIPDKNDDVIDLMELRNMLMAKGAIDIEVKIL